MDSFLEEDFLEEAGLSEPQTMTELFGHDDTEKEILEVWNSGRFPHALIFAGPEGIGKETLAFRLARFLLAEEGNQDGGGLFGEDVSAPITSLEISEDNPVARRISSGGHADLRVIQREVDEKTKKIKSEIAVKSVRKIAPFLHKTAAEGGWRIVIVNEADKLNRSGQNALLKILEEPPEKALLILVSNKPGAFLPTIRSRCRLFALQSLSTENIEKLLLRQFPDLSPMDSKSLAEMGEGSIGRAIELQESGGLELFQQVLDILKQLPVFDWEELHKLSAKQSDDNYKTFMSLLVWWVERLVRSQGRGIMPSEIIPGDVAVITKLLELYSPKKLLKIRDEISYLIEQTDRSRLDKKQTVLNVFGVFQQEINKAA